MTDENPSEQPPIKPSRAPRRRQTELDAALQEKNGWKARAMAAEQWANRPRARAENAAVILEEAIRG